MSRPCPSPLALVLAPPRSSRPTSVLKTTCLGPPAPLSAPKKGPQTELARPRCYELWLPPPSRRKLSPYHHLAHSAIVFLGPGPPPPINYSRQPRLWLIIRRPCFFRLLRVPRPPCWRHQANIPRFHYSAPQSWTSRDGSSHHPNVPSAEHTHATQSQRSKQRPSSPPSSQTARAPLPDCCRAGLALPTTHPLLLTARIRPAPGIAAGRSSPAPRQLAPPFSLPPAPANQRRAPAPGNS